MSHVDFLDPGPLVDGELEIVLVQTHEGVPTVGLSPYYEFEMRVGGQRAGRINLRIGDTTNLVMYAGHIGYGVEPQFRGHHYAERACRLILPLAKCHGLEVIWITANPDNIASRRTIEHLGATFIETIPVPEDNDQYRRGDRRKCRYRLEI